MKPRIVGWRMGLNRWFDMTTEHLLLAKPNGGERPACGNYPWSFSRQLTDKPTRPDRACLTCTAYRQRRRNQEGSIP